MASKTIPAVQPWMLPLSSEQYPNITLGEGLPNWSSTGRDMATAGTYTMGQLPELTRPSGQYVSRLSPSAIQQYYGYEQMRTGARPEDTEYQLNAWNPMSSANLLQHGR